MKTKLNESQTRTCYLLSQNENEFKRVLKKKIRLLK